MGVTDPTWWAQWWAWMVLWLATFSLVLVAAVMAAVHHWSYGRRAAARAAAPSIAIYLDDTLVMDLYESRGFDRDLEQQIIETRRRGREGWLSAKLPLGNSGGKINFDTEEMRTYLKTAKPTTVMHDVIAGLESNDHIVHVDLEQRTITADAAFDKVPRRPQEDDQHAGMLQLTKLRGRLVSVQGEFEKRDAEGTSVVFEAPYGHTDSEEQSPAAVRIACDPDGFRMGVSAYPFPARCLGWVEHWDNSNAKLIIRPIAVFH